MAALQTLTELAPLLALLDAALLETGFGCYSKNSTCAVCPEQLRHSLGWIWYFSLLA